MVYVLDNSTTEIIPVIEKTKKWVDSLVVGRSTNGNTWKKGDTWKDELNKIAEDRTSDFYLAKQIKRFEKLKPVFRKFAK